MTIDVRKELSDQGLGVGHALYEKCLFGSGVYPLGDDNTLVVKAELADTPGRMRRETTYMELMAKHGVGPQITGSGSFEVLSEGKWITYVVMNRYMTTLATVEQSMASSSLLDHSTGWMLNNLLKRTAYRARMLLTDLKPSNIVANLDLDKSTTPRARVCSIVLIDFGPADCRPLPPGVTSRTAYVAMLLLYSSISRTLGFTRCAELLVSYIQRRTPSERKEARAWMATQPIIRRALRHYQPEKNSLITFY